MYSPALPLPRARALSPCEIEVEPGGLESSLHDLVDEYHRVSCSFEEQSEKSKKDVIRTAKRVSESLVESVDKGVRELFGLEESIEHEIRQLTATISKFSKLTDQWLTATRDMNSTVKEIGDFENWMKTMASDCKHINEVICNIHRDRI